MTASAILDLKRRALQEKRAGNTKEAVKLLREAKKLEFEQAQEKQEKQAPSQAQQPSDPAAVAAADNEEDESANDEDDEALRALMAREGNANVNADDENALLGLTDSDNDDDAVAFDPSAVTFTAAEMKDEEMMTEFKSSGMPVPSDDAYRAEVRRCKAQALQLKQAGRVPEATKELRAAKQLEAVRAALARTAGGEADVWLQELDRYPDASGATEEEDSAMEVGGDSDAATTKFVDSMDLDVADVEKMSTQELVDAAEMGMGLPSLESVLQKAQQHKTQALASKQQNDLEGAKRGLLDFKRMQAVAETLRAARQHVERMQRRDSQDKEEMTLEEMEAMLEVKTASATNGKTTATAASQPAAEATAKPRSPEKTAAQLKQEAIRLRNAGNKTEATRVLLLYKEALKQEDAAAEAKRRQARVEVLEKEAQLARQQHFWFFHYQPYCGDDVSASQAAFWESYAKQCLNAARVVQRKGSASIVMARASTTKNAETAPQALRIVDEEHLTRLVEKGVAGKEERLQVAIVYIKNVRENKAFKKWLAKKAKESSGPHHYTLRVEATLQIPPSEQERDKNVELHFDSPHCAAENPAPDGSNKTTEEPDRCCRLNKSHYVSVPRGESKFADTVRRRIERGRKIQIHVYLLPQQAPATKSSKGWFERGSHANKESSEEAVHLGKVVLELKDLLLRNCIAGEFAIVTVGKAVGGSLGLVVRTGSPLDPTQWEGGASSDAAKLEPYDALSVALAKAAEESS